MSKSDPACRFGYGRSAASLLLGLSLAILPLSSPGSAQSLRQKLQFLREAREQNKENEKTAKQISQSPGNGTEKIQIGGLDVAVWKPNAPGKAPLIIFSHGFGGSNTQSIFIMRALADAGYLVVAPNHHDAHALTNHQKPQISFSKPSQWSDKTYEDRRRDIVNLIDALHQDASWDSRIDWDKVGLCGHSLGGYTVLGLAGAWPRWKLKEARAVLALSPYCLPYLPTDDLKNIDLPVMYQGGSKDFAITPSVRNDHGAYAKTASPAYFVEFDGAGHFAWTGFNHNQKQQKAINHYCVAFMDRYLKGDSQANLRDKLDGVIELESK